MPGIGDTALTRGIGSLISSTWAWHFIARPNATFHSPPPRGHGHAVPFTAGHVSSTTDVLSVASGPLQPTLTECSDREVGPSQKMFFSRRPVPAGFPRFRLRPVGCSNNLDHSSPPPMLAVSQLRPGPSGLFGWARNHVAPAVRGHRRATIMGRDFHGSLRLAGRRHPVLGTQIWPVRNRVGNCVSSGWRIV